MSRPDAGRAPAPRRIASNFVFMSLAEIVCRGASVAVTLTLAKRLGMANYGRVGFAFDIVFWLVLLVRDAFEVIIARELARHPRLVRPLVNHVLALRGVLSLSLFVGLVAVELADDLRRPRTGRSSPLYGLMLLTTALGLDFVYRGTERMGLVAVSLSIRTLIYAIGVWTERGRRLADRLGAGLAGAGRGVRDRAGLGLLLPTVRTAPAGPGRPVPPRLPQAGPLGLLDPDLADGDRLGRPDGGRPDEPVGPTSGATAPRIG